MKWTYRSLIFTFYLDCGIGRFLIPRRVVLISTKLLCRVRSKESTNIDQAQKSPGNHMISHNEATHLNLREAWKINIIITGHNVLRSRVRFLLHDFLVSVVDVSTQQYFLKLFTSHCATERKLHAEYMFVIMIISSSDDNNDFLKTIDGILKAAPTQMTYILASRFIFHYRTNTVITGIHLLVGLFLFDTILTLVLSAYCGILVEACSKHSVITSPNISPSR